MIQHTLNYSLHNGVNLLGFPLQLEDPSLESVFGTSGTIFEVVGEGQAANLFNETWVGSLDEINPLSSYWVKVDGSTEISITGTSIGTPEYSVHYGANLLSFPGNDEIPISEAMEGVGEGIHEIIGEGAAALRLENGQWAGSLDYLKPTNGYWFLANQAMTFTFNAVPFQQYEDEGPDVWTWQFRECMGIMRNINRNSEDNSVDQNAVNRLCHRMIDLGWIPRVSPVTEEDELEVPE